MNKAVDLGHVTMRGEQYPVLTRVGMVRIEVGWLVPLLGIFSCRQILLGIQKDFECGPKLIVLAISSLVTKVRRRKRSGTTYSMRGVTQ